MEFEKPPKKEKKAGSQGPVKKRREKQFNKLAWSYTRPPKANNRIFFSLFSGSKANKTKEWLDCFGGAKKTGKFLRVQQKCAIKATCVKKHGFKQWQR